MPQRLTIQYVKKFVNNRTNGKCKVTDDVYTNSSTPIRILCKCGNTFERDFGHIRRGQLYCTQCVRNEMSERNREPLENVIKRIEQTGCEYISGVYTNNNSILTIRCRCGNIFKKSASKFFSGQDRCQECGRKKLVEAKRKYSVEDVKKEISKRGYKILNDDEYVDTTHNIKCVCSNGHEFDLNFGRYLQGKSGCKKCSILAMSGINSHYYQYGQSDVFDSLRKSISEWKRNIKTAYGGKCALTGTVPKRLDIHHIDNFRDILNDCVKETGIEVKEHLYDYDNYKDYETLKNAVVKKHKTCLGIAISHSIHQKFHAKYQGRTTRKQFEEFLLSEYDVKLDKILI